MKADLKNVYNISALTMHDKPHERFKQLGVEEKHCFYEKLADQYGIDGLKDAKEESLLTEFVDGLPAMKAQRPAILVSSSSWTEDEDFHILVEALESK